jgi:glycosyltransferase involved in cell wall biosynthesis
MSRVSVIIPCFNREALLCETLNSVRSQSCGDWEAIVIDDHSQDSSLQVAQGFGRKDSRIRAVRRKCHRKGGNICRNEGLSLAKGEYVIFLDSDDLLSKTCLEHRVAAMDNAPECGFGVYQTELFTRGIGDRKVLWNAFNDVPDLHRFLSLDVVWLTTGPIWRRQTVIDLGGFDENLLCFQDWDLHVRALSKGVKYFKEAIRDNFHRFAHDATNQISMVSSRQPEHLISREELFSKAFRDLQARGLVDGEIRHRMAGLFWWQATRWEEQGNIGAADKAWLKAASLGLCSRRQYLEGRLIFRLNRVRPGTRVVKLIQRFWPSQYTRICSVSLAKTPVGRTEPAQALSKPEGAQAGASRADH